MVWYAANPQVRGTMTDEELLANLPAMGPDAAPPGDRFARTFQPEGKGGANARPGLCTGQRTGWQCKRYWAASFRDEIRNQADLHEGKRQRLCLMTDADPDDLGNNTNEVATYCTRYEPSRVRYDPLFDGTEKPQPLPMDHWRPPGNDLPVKPGQILKWFSNRVAAIVQPARQWRARVRAFLRGEDDE